VRKLESSLSGCSSSDFLHALAGANQTKEDLSKRGGSRAGSNESESTIKECSAAARKQALIPVAEDSWRSYAANDDVNHDDEEPSFPEQTNMVAALNSSARATAKARIASDSEWTLALARERLIYSVLAINILAIDKLLYVNGGKSCSFAAFEKSRIYRLLHLLNNHSTYRYLYTTVYKQDLQKMADKSLLTRKPVSLAQ